ncbi:DUF4321 domain-containing protein [Clostridium ganghwense]|uniref:DUF4321 domain-containing protein n=1 Tax=Clostridium ganghwense TaxID=312089 RepID=A0ABT4CQN1_9CLOT|nr:DUF4321 domain-containing protein [Clostridium ganghwense]MCY6370753.1 DUF4321 domain-containing protein [Clostridium ganghwense]
MVRSSGKGGLLAFVILLGAISGNFIGDILGSSVKTLSFLKISYPIGTSSPFILNLKVIKLTFGINFNMNLMAIIGAILAMILYRKY